MQRNIGRIAADISDVVRTRREDESRGRAAVVCWDLAHNPVGRAYVIYQLLEADWEVDLVGPMWSRFGEQLWEPLATTPLSVRTFGCRSVVDYLPRAVAVAAQKQYDLVVCVKNRLPGLHLATMIAEISDAPMVLDIDDDESAFADDLPDEHRDPDGYSPITQLLDVRAAELAERSVSLADAITVVSRPLQDRHGGIMVRHARQTALRPGSQAADRVREANRLRCGIGDDEVALFFIGTVRPHKGIQQIIEALVEMGRPEVRLHIFTTTSDREVDAIVRGHIDHETDRYVTHGPSQFDELPALLSAADLVVLAQEQGSVISEYQIPAKVSDATATGCPVLVPESGVFADLAADGLVVTYGPGRLRQKIEAIIDSGRDKRAAQRLQDRFRGELSLAANRGPLAEAIELAQSEHTSTGPRPTEAFHDKVLEHYRWRRAIGGPDVGAASPPAIWPVGIDHDRQYDIAFFWKQNDSGLYGRRSDMIVKEALAQGRIRRAVHFDAPARASELHRRIPAVQFGLPCESEYVLANIVDRHLGIGNQDSLQRRCFLYRDVDFGEASLFGAELPTIDDYPTYILRELAAAGMEPATTIAWVWPVAAGFRNVLNEVGFGAVVCDLVDDQRMWPNLSERYAEFLTDEYAAATSAADIVFTNTPANGEAFREFGKAAAVVPNGAELDAVEPSSNLVSDLGDGPILGYVGNMRDRVDWDLLEAVAAHDPTWNVVLAGEVAPDSPVFSLASRFPNVHILGVVPYELARSLIASFDVGLIPHVISDQSMRMDPLKLYNFVALGVPVISTAHPSARGFASGVVVAETAPDFCASIEATLDADRDPDQGIDLGGISWSSRVERMFSMIDGLHVPMPVDEDVE